KCPGRRPQAMHQRSLTCGESYDLSAISRAQARRLSYRPPRIAPSKINWSREVFKMSESAETVVRKYLAAWKRSDLDELVSFISDDAVYTDGPRGVHHGIDAIRAELGAMVKDVPS